MPHDTIDSNGEIVSIGGAAHSLTDDGSDNLTLSAVTDLFFDDSVQSSAIALSDTDDGFLSGDTALVDAINAAYAAGTGGAGDQAVPVGEI